MQSSLLLLRKNNLVAFDGSLKVKSCILIKVSLTVNEIWFLQIHQDIQIQHFFLFPMILGFRSIRIYILDRKQH